MLAYKLNNPINGQKLLMDIQNFIRQNNVDGENSLLVITIKNISQDNTTIIPKLTLKQED
jgi:hypothetical protein